MNRATIVKVDGSIITLDSRPTLKEAQAIVGGWIEQLKAKHVKTGAMVTLVVDEEGKVKSKQTNDLITKTFGQSVHGGFIVGDVIVLEGWRTVKGVEE